MSLYDIPLTRLNGTPASLAEYRGQALLVVNVASKCGLTPQYTGLSALYDRFEDKGFQVLAFPCNDFAGQEPGSAEEIQTFCERNYGVRFPVFSKVHANGEERHPLYQALIAAQPKAQPKEAGQLLAKLAQHGLGPKNDSDVAWNFEKFLVSRDGQVIARFAPDVEPQDPALVTAIEGALG
ncbi:glutathione peroxidase [Nitrospirillum sp. BR 11752]|uniref:glutathione peroxidase n=1 Tax=Nitrospirillum sp. BR 11752 TaxID=3104293 RepID=UPI002E9B46B0|nr:glutathione peroxidase [Nitrospirillum sp. BR 11752]